MSFKSFLGKLLGSPRWQRTKEQGAGATAPPQEDKRTRRKKRVLSAFADRQDRLDAKMQHRQHRVRMGLIANPAGFRWSTGHRKQEFLIEARKEELIAKGIIEPS